MSEHEYSDPENCEFCRLVDEFMRKAQEKWQQDESHPSTKAGSNRE